MSLIAWPGVRPAPREANDVVIREIYALSTNPETKFADWVAYRVTRETIGTSDPLERSWQNDELLAADEILLSAKTEEETRLVMDRLNWEPAKIAENTAAKNSLWVRG